MGAEVGFEPHDLKVMSLASYQTALLCYKTPVVGFEPTVVELTVRCLTTWLYWNILFIKIGRIGN